jgi:hypothetical protein
VEVADAEAQVVASSDVGVVVSLRWRLKGAEEVYREYQALKLRDGLVFDMQAYRQERAARRAIGAAS